ncbi:hypothetical protein PoB_007393400 [Plakobranchus ocellatus]|uniref:Uncharacterized protein n=1 Tax=Plakobranchus ocellatus TaxID=259542 RepID=A0AAV4DTV0_9GAST|nr:hypothetical protein PoB_007393400 [Plakobranchus ocellatus]
MDTENFTLRVEFGRQILPGTVHMHLSFISYISTIMSESPPVKRPMLAKSPKPASPATITIEAIKFNVTKAVSGNEHVPKETSSVQVARFSVPSPSC